MKMLEQMRRATDAMIQTIRNIREAQKELPQILEEAKRVSDATRKIYWHTTKIEDNERDRLRNILLDKLPAGTENIEHIVGIAKEYSKIYETEKLDKEHRELLLKHMEKTAPEDAHKLKRILQAINSGKKEHAQLLVEKLSQHGVDTLHGVAQRYVRADGNTKEVIISALQHAKSPQHVERVEYYARIMRTIHPAIKQTLPKLIRQASSFEEADKIIMAAHHASQSIRAGGQKEDILSAFKDKETLIKRFGMPARGWEPYAPRNKEIR